MPEPLTLRIIGTFYDHLGEHSGFRQVRTRFDPARIRWHEQFVIKDGRYRSAGFRAIRRLTRTWFSKPPQQYMLEDWLAERQCDRACRDGNTGIVQFIDAEHSLRHLPRWSRQRGGHPKVAGMFHLPPDISGRMVSRDVVRQLDAVMGVGGEQVDWLRSWLDPARVHLVRHGIDEEFFHPRAEGPPPGPPWRVVTVGAHLRDYQFLFSVARLFADVREVEFHTVHRHVPGTVIPPNVRAHAGISDDALAELYRSCHVCFLPLQQITASNAMLEAMASALPVVTTDLRAARTYADETNARFYPAGDAEAAASQLNALLNDPASCRALGAAGRAKAEHCTWRHTAETMTRIYEALA